MVPLAGRKTFDPTIQALTAVNAFQGSVRKLPETFTRKEAILAHAKVSALFNECKKIIIAPVEKRKRILDILHIDVPAKPQKPMQHTQLPGFDLEFGKAPREGLFARIKVGTLNALDSIKRAFGVVAKTHTQRVIPTEMKFFLPRSSKKVAQKMCFGETPEPRESIASGSFGDVREVQQGQDYYAEKCPRKPKITPYGPHIDPDEADRKFQEASELLDKEATVLMQLKPHPHIVSLEAFSDKGIYLQLENKNLAELVKKPCRSSKILIRYMREIVSGVDHLHCQGFTHKDLKPSNILLDDDDHIRICDFGVSALSNKDTLFAGTPRHIAPEVYCKRVGSIFMTTHPLAGLRTYITPQVDIWSLGVAFFLLLAGEHPYKRLKGESREDCGERHASNFFNLTSKEYLALEELRIESHKAKASRKKSKFDEKSPEEIKLLTQYTELLPTVRKQHDEALTAKQSLFTDLDVATQERLERLDPTGELRKLTLHCLHGNPGVLYETKSGETTVKRLPLNRRRPVALELLRKLLEIEKKAALLPAGNLPVLDVSVMAEPMSTSASQKTGTMTKLAKKIIKATINTGMRSTDPSIGSQFRSKLVFN